MLRVTGKIAVILISMTALIACGVDRTSPRDARLEIAADAININTSGVNELRRIPNIGEKLALKIVEFREKHGPFRRPENLLLINGISDRRFREIRHLVRVE